MCVYVVFMGGGYFVCDVSVVVRGMCVLCTVVHVCMWGGYVVCVVRAVWCVCGTVTNLMVCEGCSDWA